MRTLEELKSIVRLRLKPYQWNVKSADYHALQMAIDFSTDNNQVEKLYTTWQERLRLKNIAILPDLNAKPSRRKQTQIRNAA